VTESCVLDTAAYDAWKLTITNANTAAIAAAVLAATDPVSVTVPDGDKNIMIYGTALSAP